MEIIDRIDQNLFCLALLAILAIGSGRTADGASLERRLFGGMLLSAAIMLVADTCMWLLDGSDDPAVRAGLVASSTLYYALHPFTAFLYALYVEHHSGSDARALRRRAPAIAAPFVANALIALSSPATGLYFLVDGAGKYHRGPLFLVFAAATFGYFAYTSAIVVARRERLDRAGLGALLAFPAPPVLGGLIQSLNFGLVLIWPGTCLSLLVIFVIVQQRQMATDYLTGLMNRRSLDEHLAYQVKAAREGRPLAAFMVDVDDFKSINDRHGHAEGDRALKRAASILRSCLRADDFLARFAGDEFVAVLSGRAALELGSVVARVRERAEQAGTSRSAPYALSFSIGAAPFDPAADQDADAFLRRLDELMYGDKAARKGAR